MVMLTAKMMETPMEKQKPKGITMEMPMDFQMAT